MIQRRTHIAIVILSAVFFFSQPAVSHAQTQDVPHTISYQGILIDRSGMPVPDGQHSLTLRLYVDSLGIVGIWFSNINVVTKNGIFNSILGAPYTDPLPASISLNRPLWLGVQVDSNQEMRPLTPVTGTMYALNVADNSISTEKIQDSAVTLPKIQPEFLGSVSMSGNPITTKGGNLDLEAGRGINFNGDFINHRITINSQTVIDTSLAGAGLSLDTVKTQLNVNTDSVTIGILNDTLRVLAHGIANFIANDSVVWNAVSAAIDSSVNIHRSIANLISGDTVIWNAIALAVDSSKNIHNAFTYVIASDSGVRNAITNLVVLDIHSDTAAWNAIAHAIDSSKNIHISILNLIKRDSAIRGAITNLVVNDIQGDTNVWNAIANAIDSSRNIHIAVNNLINGDTAIQHSIVNVVNNAVNTDTAFGNTLNQFINRGDRGRAGAGLSFDTTADAFNVNVDNKTLSIVNDTLVVKNSGIATMIRQDTTIWNAIATSVDSSQRIQISIANQISGDTIIWNSISIAIDSSRNIQQSIVNLISRDTSMQIAIANFFNSDTAIQNVLTTIVNNAITNDTTLQKSINTIVNRSDTARAGAGLSYDTARNEFNVNVDNRTIGIVNDTLVLKDTGVAKLIRSDTIIWNAVSNAIDTSTVIQQAILNIIAQDTALANTINQFISEDTSRAGNGLSYNSSTRKYDVNVDNKTLGIANDTLYVITKGIATMIAGDTIVWNAIATSIDSSVVVQQAILNIIATDTALTNIVNTIVNNIDSGRAGAGLSYDTATHKFSVNVDNKTIAIVNDSLAVKPSGIKTIINTDTSVQNAINQTVNAANPARAGNGLSYDTAANQFNVNVDDSTISIVNDTLKVNPSGIATIIKTDTNVWNSIATSIDSSTNIQTAINNVIVAKSDSAAAGNGLSYNSSTKKLDVNVDDTTIGIVNDTLKVKPSGVALIINTDTSVQNAINKTVNAANPARAGNGLSYDTAANQFNVNADDSTISIVNDTLKVNPSGIATIIKTDTNVWNSIATSIDSSTNIQTAINNVVTAKSDSAAAGNGLSYNSSTKKLDVNVDDKTIEIANDTLSVKPYGIGNAQLDSLAVTNDKIADTTIFGSKIHIPLILTRSTPGAVLIGENTSDNVGGVPVISFTGSSSDGTPTLSVSGAVSGGALAEFHSTAASSEALVAQIEPPTAPMTTVEGIRGEVSPDVLSTNAPLYGVHGRISGNVQGDSSAGVYGESVAANGAVYGVVGVSNSASQGAAGVRAVGAGVASPGNPNAAALEVHNGAFRVTGTVKPAGTQSVTISTGMKSVQVTVNNPLVQPNSYIVVSANANGGDAALGTDKDTFTALVRVKSAGSFTVEISCDQGNVPAAEDVTLDYLIMNQ